MSEQSDEFLAFRVDSFYLAVRIHEVQEVLEFSACDALSNMPDSVLGFMDVRGEGLMVLEPYRFLRVERMRLSFDASVRVVRFVCERFGLLVDQVFKILVFESQHDKSALSAPLPDVLNACVSGVGRYDGQLFGIVEMERLSEALREDVAAVYAVDSFYASLNRYELSVQDAGSVEYASIQEFMRDVSLVENSATVSGVSLHVERRCLFSGGQFDAVLQQEKQRVESKHSVFALNRDALFFSPVDEYLFFAAVFLQFLSAYKLLEDGKVSVLHVGGDAGASVYSLGVLLHAWLQIRGSQLQVSYVATDSNEERLVQAEKAEYSPLQLQRFAQEDRDVYFRYDDEGACFVLKEEFRNAVRFCFLKDVKAFGKVDCIFCPYVFYLYREEQVRDFLGALDMLNEGGLLITSSIEVIPEPHRYHLELHRLHGRHFYVKRAEPTQQILSN